MMAQYAILRVLYTVSVLGSSLGAKSVPTIHQKLGLDVLHQSVGSSAHRSPAHRMKNSAQHPKCEVNCGSYECDSQRQLAPGRRAASASLNERRRRAPALLAVRRPSGPLLLALTSSNSLVELCLASLQPCQALISHFPVGQLRSYVVGPEYVGQIQGSQVVGSGRGMVGRERGAHRGKTSGARSS